APAKTIIRSGIEASLARRVNGQRLQGGRLHVITGVEIAVQFLQQRQGAGCIRGGHGSALCKAVGVITRWGYPGRENRYTCGHEVGLNPPIVRRPPTTEGGHDNAGGSGIIGHLEYSPDRNVVLSGTFGPYAVESCASI